METRIEVDGCLEWCEAVGRSGIEGELREILLGGKAELIDRKWIAVTFLIDEWVKVVALEPHRGAIRKVGMLVGVLEETFGIDRLTVRVRDAEGVWPAVNWWLAEKYTGSTVESRYRSEMPHAIEVMKETPGKFTSRKLAGLYSWKLWRAVTGKRKKQMQGFDTHDRKWKNITRKDVIEILAYRPWLTGLVRIQPDKWVYENFEQ